MPPFTMAAPALAGWNAQSDLGGAHLGWRLLRFTPRVALLEEAIVMELRASERLFGGSERLCSLVVDEARAHGWGRWARAGTALAAVALARAFAGENHEDPGASSPSEAMLSARLDTLPLEVLAGVAQHAATLARLGCRTLADVRALPRGGLSRRFGAGLLHTLDQAYGLRPQAFEWLTLPPVFDARLELPGRVESAPGLLFAATRLLQQLCAWLAGHQAGVCAFTLRWRHDGQGRHCAPEGEWTVRLASPTRDIQRLGALLAEHLQRLTLSAPVGELSLHAHEIELRPSDNAPLFAEHREHRLGAADTLQTAAARQAQREALLALLDKLSVRLTPQRVQCASLHADHRLECMQRWQPAVDMLTAPPVSAEPAPANLPQPGWLLPEPLLLALDQARGQHPVYQGPLALLAGPHRVEAGWWDADTAHARVTRDYYLASSAQAGLLWIFKVRQAPEDTRSPWYLHGFFA